MGSQLMGSFGYWDHSVNGINFSKVSNHIFPENVVFVSSISVNVVEINLDRNVSLKNR